MPRHGRHHTHRAARRKAGSGYRCLAAGTFALDFRNPGPHHARTILRGEAEEFRDYRRGSRVSSPILHIASNTFREAVRDRVLYNLIAFALLLSGAAVLVGQISIDIERLVVVNL